MSSKKWTKNQQLAIDSRKGSILISAAAGSGKTAVLVERVTKTLTDKENPCDADKLLIVTFTNAAAAEMRERISNKISEMIEEFPYDQNLKRQRTLLANAHISTIHSFCSELIRENFYKLNISSDFKIADSNEIALIRQNVIESILEAKYKKNDSSFINLVESFGSVKDDSSLIKIINTLYDFVRSHPFPNIWLDQKLQMYKSSNSIAKTIFGEVILEYSKTAITYCSNIIENLLLIILDENDFSEAYTAAFTIDYEALKNIEASLSANSWDEISYKIKSFKQATIKRLKGHKDDPLKIKIMENRKEIKSILENLKSLFSFSENECLEDTKRLYSVVEELFSLVKLFEKEFYEIKKKRNICDFGDLEHLTLKLLVKSTDTGFSKTQEALEISKKFKFIMVDEYQDTNEAQDMIFRAISNKENNLFTVGDVKQSIYRFRQAMPEIFLRRKESYKKYEKELDNYPGKIILDKNFRSRLEILDCINFIFHQIMSKDIGDMEYTNEEELHLGANYEDIKDNRISIEIIDPSESSEKNIDILEARRIAKIIKDLINQKYIVSENGSKRPATYKDFCILLRSTSKHANVFLDELTKEGVPATSDITTSFFKTVEISTILSLLNIINNPLDDISFLSAITSPIFSLKYDEIAFIRSSNPDLCIYLSIKNLADGGNKKYKNILDKIEKYRMLAISLSCEDLLNYIYKDSGYTYMVEAMPEGNLRINNLRLLFEYAKTYESTSQKGLSGFIKFINSLKESKGDLAATSPSIGIENSVKIMSIHRSKGLEFPICILANCSRKFNKDRDDVLIHKELGIGINLLDNNHGCRYPSIQREAVKLALEKDSISEELRILYVALTRAKEKLILITTIKNPQRTLTKLASQITRKNAITPYVVRNCNSFSDWILMCAIRHPSGKNLRKLINESSDIVISNNTFWEINIVSLVDEASKITDPSIDLNSNLKCSKIDSHKIDSEFLLEMDRRFNYIYPYEKLTSIPNKVTVTDIVSANRKKDFDFAKRPSFLLKENISPAEKGIALHTFMQFVNFKSAFFNLDSEINRLTENNFLSSVEAKSLDKIKIKKFLNSTLAKRIMESSKLLREYQFTVNIDSSEYDCDIPKSLDSKIILQGSIDCAFLEDKKYVIVDYKTDKVASIEETVAHYKKQLELYNNAFTKCTGEKIKQNVLYLFYTSKSIFL